MRYHLTAFILGYLLDLAVGDPEKIPHPVIGIGKLISFYEKHYMADDGRPNGSKQIIGMGLVFFTCSITVCAVMLLLFASYCIHPIAGLIIESILTCMALAGKSLKVESMKVYDALEHGTIEDARKAVSMIVGRDTASLDDVHVTRAAVETVSENTSDGVIAPMLYLAIGGPVLGWFYKAVNTMDSMVGYKNERYIDYGMAAARFDDFVNFVPSRISAWLMIFSCLLLGKDYSAGEAKRIYLRDRLKHASPNSAQTESVMAGALGLLLAGPSSYFGKLVQKPFIGDGRRSIEHEDIRRANRLMYMTALICEILCVLAMCFCMTLAA